MIGKLDEKDIVGVQILPKKWPRKVQLLCAHLLAKEGLLIRGLEIGGGHVELHEPRQGVAKLSIENIPLDVPNEIVKSWAAQYGTVVDYRNEHPYINGKRVSWRSGTRYAYIINMTVPPNVTKSLSEPTLTFRQRFCLAFSREQFSSDMLMHLIRKMYTAITFLKSLPYHPGDNGLTSCTDSWLEVHIFLPEKCIS